MDLGTASPSTPEPPSTAAGADLQFDSADFGEEAKPSLACAACKRDIFETYYAAGEKILCAACRETLTRQLHAGSRAGRFGRALLFGVPAAVLGSALYYAIAALTGYEFGLVAIVIGILVGGAVKHGSRGRGGWVYQGLAMLLTYVAITATYVPYIIAGLQRSAEAERANAAKQGDADGQVARVSDAAEAVPANGEPRAAQAEGDTKPLGLGAAVATLAVLLIVASLAPFFGGLMGVVILGIGLYEAWKINRRVEPAISGPHRVAAAPS